MLLCSVADRAYARNRTAKIINHVLLSIYQKELRFSSGASFPLIITGRWEHAHAETLVYCIYHIKLRRGVARSHLTVCSGSKEWGVSGWDGIVGGR